MIRQPIDGVDQGCPPLFAFHEFAGGRHNVRRRTRHGAFAMQSTRLTTPRVADDVVHDPCQPRPAVANRSRAPVTFPDPTPATPNSILICGSRRYSSLDSTSQTMDLGLTGSPGLGKVVVVQARAGVAGGACALLASPAAGEFPLGISASRLLLATTFAVAAVKPIGAGGAVDFPLTVPNQGSLVGQEVYLQAWGLGAGRWTASSGLEIKVCK